MTGRRAALSANAGALAPMASTGFAKGLDSSIGAARGMQKALVRLGYLAPELGTGEFDWRSERALMRFKRHASRTYRMSAVTGRPADVPRAACFTGVCDGRIDGPVLAEASEWLHRGWSLPLGRFKLAPVAQTRRAPNWPRKALLREDVARVWTTLADIVRKRGGTVDGPYGDTWRPVGFHGKDGVSMRSFHIAGRAVDLNQDLARAPNQRYFLEPEPAWGAMYFRIWCLTAKQDGSQGRYKPAGTFANWRFGNALTGNASGWYLDLTSILEVEGGFERIPAQQGWLSNYVRGEWWHYQYAFGKQETFLDECELVGIGEDRLLRAGYSFWDMDGEPG